MPIEDFVHASGNRIMAGVAGEKAYLNLGRIDIAKAAHVGWDSNLWAALKIAVDQTRLWVVVLSVDTGTHAPGSRHYRGCAVDIDRMGRIQGPLREANLANPAALGLVHYLHAHGWEPAEGGPHPAFLLGPPHTAMNLSSVPHLHHCHISVDPRVPGAVKGEAADVGPVDDE